jgi:Zn ribbon nucleic-acid-binding protein
VWPGRDAEALSYHPAGGGEPTPAEDNGHMESLVVECLRCGSHRQADPAPLRTTDSECHRCGYVGWAAAANLSEHERRALRRRPLERRRLRLA